MSNKIKIVVSPKLFFDQMDADDLLILGDYFFSLTDSFSGNYANAFLDHFHSTVPITFLDGVDITLYDENNNIVSTDDSIPDYHYNEKADLLDFIPLSW